MRCLQLLLPILVLVLLVQVVAPDTSLAQSVFALTNLGQPIDSDDARIVGRGGWGMAVHDSLNPGFSNVASLTALRHVAVKFTAYGENNTNTDENGSRTTHRTLIPDIRVGLPILKGRLAFSSGIQVGRSFEYRTLTTMTWMVEDETLTGEKQFRREGTLWQIPTALSLRLFKYVSVAGTIGLVNGTIRETTDNFFLEPANSAGSPLYLSNRKVQEDEFSGKMTTWSFHLGSENGIAIGGSWTPAHNLEAERKVSMGGLSERANSQWTFDVPETFRAGFQMKLSNRWRLGADGIQQKYGDFSGNSDWSDDTVDEYSVAFGLERKLSYERHGGMANLPLRFGAKYRRWAFKVGGEEVEEKTFSLGTGFPFHRKMGMLDVALSYSMIGDQSKNGMDSKVWRMTVSVTGLEKWW